MGGDGGMAASITALRMPGNARIVARAANVVLNAVEFCGEERYVRNQTLKHLRGKKQL